MTEIKFLAKDNGIKTEYFWEGRQGVQMGFTEFISQETAIENGKEVPKWTILVREHSELEKTKNSTIRIIEIGTDEEYDYEISFVDEPRLRKWAGKYGDGSEGTRYFSENDSITIKDKYYSTKLAKLKSLSSDKLIPGEVRKWEKYIEYFRRELSSLTGKDTSKYQEGKKFIDELESELNKKTGKDNNKDDDREREREREQNRQVEVQNPQIRGYNQ